MKQRLIKFFGIVVVMMLAFSCNNISNEQQKEIAETNDTAYLVLNINRNASRTIFAPEYDLENLYYTLTMTNANGVRKTAFSYMSYDSMSTQTIVVDVGAWDFELKASYKYYRYSGSYWYDTYATCYSATLEEVEIVTGENILSFELKETSETINDGKGGVSVTLYFPKNAGVSKVQAGLFNTEFNAVYNYENCSFYESSNELLKCVNYEKSNVTKGTYIISFRFFDKYEKEIMPGYSELIQVKDNRTSTAERTFENLETLHKITYNPNGGTLNGGTMSFTEKENVVLPKAEDISRAYYTFSGWYTESDFSGESITEISNGTTTDITVYAKWTPIEYTITYEGLEGAENSIYNPATFNIESGNFALRSPTKIGYNFIAWYKSSNYSYGTDISSINSLNIHEDITIYARWSPQTNIRYTVNHLQQNIDDDEYTLYDTSVCTGTTGNLTYVDGYVKTYAGFESGKFKNVKIAGDGSTVVDIKYDRKIIKYYFDYAYSNTNYEDTWYKNGQYYYGKIVSGKYGAPVTSPVPERIGYNFGSWKASSSSNYQVPETFTSSDCTFNALWTARRDIKYVIEHWQENLDDDDYTLVETEERQNGITDSSTVGLMISKYYSAFQDGTYTNTTIAGDGSTVIVVKYKRKIITLRFDYDNDRESYDNSWYDSKSGNRLYGKILSGKYGATVTPPTPTKTGYTFKGWNTTVFTTFAIDYDFTAQWIANKLGITVTLSPRTDIQNLSYKINGNTLTLTAESGHDTYAWYIDLEKQTDTSNVLQLDLADIEDGLYSVMVLVDGKYTSTATVEIKR